MAPKKTTRVPTKPAPQVDMSDSDEPTQSQDASQLQSQEIDTKALEKLVQRQKEQSKARKQQRQQEVEAARQMGIEKIQRKMKELKKAHDAEIRNLRAPKLARLGTLIQQRRDIDARIETCYTQIDQAYESTIEQYQFVLDGRLEDMN